MSDTFAATVIVIPLQLHGKLVNSAIRALVVGNLDISARWDHSGAVYMDPVSRDGMTAEIAPVM